jgi:acyl carrier protein
MVTEDQKLNVKTMLVEQLRLRMQPTDIADDMPLFQDGLGLDSVDAIELVAAVEQTYGVVLASEEDAKRVLTTVASLTEHIVAEGGLS